jgi:hypothetical protein
VATEDRADLVTGEPPLLQKARLPGALIIIAGHSTPKSPVTLLSGRPDPVHRALGQAFGRQAIGYTAFPQFRPDTQGPETALDSCTHVDLGKSLITQKILINQLVEHTVHNGIRILPLFQLAAQFQHAVLAPRQKAQSDCYRLLARLVSPGIRR